jgi:hypothetical protein
MSNLLELASEILSVIALEIDRKSLFNPRLVFRALKAVSMREFVNRHFRTRYVMMSAVSLQNPMDISDHEALGPALRTSEICIEHLIETLNTSDNTKHWGNALRSTKCAWEVLRQMRPMKRRMNIQMTGSFPRFSSRIRVVHSIRLSNLVVTPQYSLNLRLGQPPTGPHLRP